MKFFPEKKMPYIVFSDHTSGLIEWLIKFRTKGHYNHVMFSHRQEFFASQGILYSETPFRRYMKKGNRLKFVEIIGFSDAQKLMVIESIKKKLALPFYKRIYDFLGIIGQAVGVGIINVPWYDYCSEDVPEHLKAAIITDADLKSVITAMPTHMNPESFNAYLKKFPQYFKVAYKWDSDAA